MPRDSGPTRFDATLAIVSSPRRRRHPSEARATLTASFLALLLLPPFAGLANAQECSTAICVGDPCTISGTHLLTDNCFLDFGTKTVTVTGNLVNAVDGGSFAISAGNLTVQG